MAARGADATARTTVTRGTGGFGARTAWAGRVTLSGVAGWPAASRLPTRKRAEGIAGALVAEPAGSEPAQPDTVRPSMVVRAALPVHTARTESGTTTTSATTTAVGQITSIWIQRTITLLFRTAAVLPGSCAYRNAAMQRGRLGCV